MYQNRNEMKKSWIAVWTDVNQLPLFIIGWIFSSDYYGCAYPFV